MKPLHLSFAPPERWRDATKIAQLSGESWRKLRLKILQRDNYTCTYCGYKAEKYQIVHHIDGNPENNIENNLETICQLCNLIHHAGQGCIVQGVVDLYRDSKYSQTEVIQLTRKLRAEGKTDEELIAYFGLKNKVPFKMDREYLRNLIGFVTARRGKS